jgi:hypothetical protein
LIGAFASLEQPKVVPYVAPIPAFDFGSIEIGDGDDLDF